LIDCRHTRRARAANDARFIATIAALLTGLIELDKHAGHLAAWDRVTTDTAAQRASE
jgi:hypothetical protein